MHCKHFLKRYIYIQTLFVIPHTRTFFTPLILFTIHTITGATCGYERCDTTNTCFRLSSSLKLTSGCDYPQFDGILVPSHYDIAYTLDFTAPFSGYVTTTANTQDSRGGAPWWFGRDDVPDTSNSFRSEFDISSKYTQMGDSSVNFYFTVASSWSLEQDIPYTLTVCTYIYIYGTYI